jgi:uncharacterized membrane protein
MNQLSDSFRALASRVQITVCRIILHLADREVAPLLGILSAKAREAAEAGENLDVIGAGLSEICHSLLQADLYWLSATNESNTFWNEDEAADYVDELFTDSTQRYLSEIIISSQVDYTEDEFLTIPITENLVVMITVAFEGRVKTLETELTEPQTLRMGLIALINLHHQRRLRAIQVHFLPTQFGEELALDHVLLNFPELLPL